MRLPLSLVSGCNTHRNYEPRGAAETYLVELYRQDRITHHQLTEALGLSRIETDGVLKRHKVSSGPTLEELRADTR
jgi:hypothetical protein